MDLFLDEGAAQRNEWMGDAVVFVLPRAIGFEKGGKKRPNLGQGDLKPRLLLFLLLFRIDEKKRGAFCCVFFFWGGYFNDSGASLISLSNVLKKNCIREVKNRRMLLFWGEEKLKRSLSFSHKHHWVFSPSKKMPQQITVYDGVPPLTDPSQPTL